MIAKREQKEKSMKTFLRISEYDRKSFKTSLILQFCILSVVLAFIEVLKRQTFDLSAVGFVESEK